MTSAPQAERTLRVAVLGCGNVGSALVGILQERADALVVQSGARLEIAGIAVGDIDAPGRPTSPGTCSPPTPPPWWPTRRSTSWWN